MVRIFLLFVLTLGSTLPSISLGQEQPYSTSERPTDGEEAAQRIFQEAFELETAGDEEGAKKRLEALVSLYPETEAGRSAARILAQSRVAEPGEQATALEPIAKPYQLTECEVVEAAFVMSIISGAALGGAFIAGVRDRELPLEWPRQ